MYIPYSSSTSPAFEVALGDCAHLDDRARERRREVVTEVHDARDGERCLEMHEVIRNPERVERAFTHLVQVQVVTLLRIGVLGEDEGLHAGGTDRVVDDAAELAELVEVVELADVHDRAVVDQAAGHAALLHLEARWRWPRSSARS